MDAHAMPREAGSSETAEHAFALATLGLVAGVPLGASGPLFFVAFGPGLVAGPTWGGLALFFGVVVAAIAGLAAVTFRSGRSWVVPLFAASAMLSLGVLAGNRIGPSLGVGSWPTPAPTRPPMSFAPPPVILKAPGMVDVQLKGVSGFAATRPEPYQGGLFGHWCSSKQDSEAVGGLTVHEVGRLDGEPLTASVTLDGIDLPPVWIVFQGAGSHTGISPFWRGEGRLATNDGFKGRISFDGLALGDSSPTGGWPSTLSGEIAWHCSAWQQP